MKRTAIFIVLTALTWLGIANPPSSAYDLYPDPTSGLYTERNEEQADTDVAAGERLRQVEFRFRLGQGGFQDDRSDLGQLGGGQITLDIKPVRLPLALSLTSEYYTNSADPTHTYEIPIMFAVNLLYIVDPLKWERLRLFTGGGVGRLEVPISETNPDLTRHAWLVNLELGLDYRLFWKLGFYGVGKYLYSRRDIDGERVIDFNEAILLLGLTLTFSI